jgi:hypothetical protein
MRHVERARVRGHVEVIACDTALDLRHARVDLVLLARIEPAHGRDELGVARRAVGSGRAAARAVRRAAVRADLAEAQRLAGRQPNVGREHVVDHVPVAQRAGSAAVVAGHPAERRLCGRRDIDREPQPVELQRRVQLIEHDAGLDPHRAPLDVEIEDAI